MGELKRAKRCSEPECAQQIERTPHHVFQEFGLFVESTSNLSQNLSVDSGLLETADSNDKYYGN